MENGEHISSEELFEIRSLALIAQKATMTAQLAGYVLQERILVVEQKYGLLGTKGMLDMATGKITREEEVKPPDA